MSVEYRNLGLFKLILQNLQETDSNVHSLQKAIAAFRGQFEDFRAEQPEDSAEIKRMLQDLKRNKIWFPRERV